MRKVPPGISIMSDREITVSTCSLHSWQGEGERRGDADQQGDPKKGNDCEHDSLRVDVPEYTPEARGGVPRSGEPKAGCRGTAKSLRGPRLGLFRLWNLLEISRMVSRDMQSRGGRGHVGWHGTHHRGRGEGCRRRAVPGPAH